MAGSTIHTEIEPQPVASKRATPGMFRHALRLNWSWPTELLVILMAALALRLYVVWQNPLITKDGLIYVGIARTIDHGLWLELVGDWFLFNPYPALMAWLGRQGVDFELGGQLINAISGTMALVPIYLWCRSAFDRRIAQLAALTYAFHPILARISGQVLREGLYWNLMCWAIYCYWLAARQRGWSRYLMAGLLTTGAALTRMEGAIVFLLGAMWTWTYFKEPDQGTVGNAVSGDRSFPNTPSTYPQWVAWARSSCQWAASVAMFPAILLLLNVMLIPPGQGWQGGGRWMHFAIQMVTGKDVGTSRKQPPLRMTQLVELEKQRQANEPPHVENLRDLAKSLPVWNSLGEPDMAQLRMQRFLVLAEDQQRFIFFGRFCHECIEGLLFPCVLCCFWGLYYGRKSVWQPARDWPMAIYSGVLIGLLFFHLSREFILEPRYLFCLMPFVFPWSGVGASLLHRQIGEWFQQRPAWSGFRPSAAALVLGLMLWACGKLWLGLDDRSKLVQREIGAKIQNSCPYRTKIAGPESLKRIGHYADADYFIIPKGDPQAVTAWLSQLPLDFVVLANDEPRTISGDQLSGAENSMRYRRLFQREKGRASIEVFSVRPLIRQVGS
ncbi:MAG: uncharacterized protein JWM11_4433 [Planctomycetaceae bacterium]|nr:uncharacterized protein [Planctomycetaceae bacterium]